LKFVCLNATTEGAGPIGVLTLSLISRLVWLEVDYDSIRKDEPNKDEESIQDQIVKRVFIGFLKKR
jgi:hypothetical protein